MKKLFCLILAVLLCLASCGKEVPVAETEIVEPEIEQETEPEIEPEIEIVPEQETQPKLELKNNYGDYPPMQSPEMIARFEKVWDFSQYYYECFDVLEFEGKTYVVALSGNDWSVHMFLLNEENGEETLEETAAEGSRYFFEVDFINISQGKFIEAYCATHMGNGNLLLIPIDEPSKEKYAIPAIGGLGGHDWLAQFNYLSEYGSNATRFKNGHLEADYRDINGDGHTDIVMTGIQEVNNRDRTEVVAEYDCKFVYIYDVYEDEFILDVSRSRHDELS